MKILGVTGGIGAGKSMVTQCFKELGAAIVDADAIARSVLNQDGAAYSTVVCNFGLEILNDDKEINRSKLAEIVFSNPQKLQELNAITHPCVFAEMERQIEEATEELVCLDVPLLFSCEFPFRCDKTLAVLAPKELRIERVMKRDGALREAIEARMAAQYDDETFRSMADYCIVNDGDVMQLRTAVNKVYHDVMEK